MPSPSSSWRPDRPTRQDIAPRARLPVTPGIVTPRVRYAQSPLRPECVTPRVRYAQSPLRRVSVTPSVRYAECPLRPESVIPLRGITDTWKRTKATRVMAGLVPDLRPDRGHACAGHDTARVARGAASYRRSEPDDTVHDRPDHDSAPCDLQCDRELPRDRRSTRSVGQIDRLAA